MLKNVCRINQRGNVCGWRSGYTTRLWYCQRIDGLACPCRCDSCRGRRVTCTWFRRDFRDDIVNLFELPVWPPWRIYSSFAGIRSCLPFQTNLCRRCRRRWVRWKLTCRSQGAQVDLRRCHRQEYWLLRYSQIPANLCHVDLVRIRPGVTLLRCGWRGRREWRRQQRIHQSNLLGELSTLCGNK